MGEERSLVKIRSTLTKTAGPALHLLHLILFRHGQPAELDCLVWSGTTGFRELIAAARCSDTDGEAPDKHSAHPLHICNLASNITGDWMSAADANLQVMV